MNILIAKSTRLKGKTFRVAAMEDGACQNTLWCRVDWHDDDWRVAFYDSFRGADHDWKPLESLTRGQMGLAAKAIEHVEQWIADGCTG